MEAPTISTKQLKKTLSSKKQKKETIKNILAKPYDNFWPLLSTQDNESLTKSLNELLPRLQNDKVNVPYKEIKNIPKSERKSTRELYLKLPTLTKEKGENDCIVLGINSVSTSLQNHSIGAILIAADVQPRLFVQHIIDQAVLFNIPVLIVQNLRNVLKVNCGISSSILGIVNIPQLGTKLKSLFDKICDLFKNYPVPTSHINYNRRLCLKSSEIIEISDSDMSKTIIELSEDDEKLPEQDKPPLVYPYLRRMSTHSRIFNPEPSQKTAKTRPDRMQTDPSGFLAFEPPSAAETNTQHYRSLKVKRMRGDKNRNTRKRLRK